MSPAACAASTFCFSPPIGSTRPWSVTSPVMPTVCFTGRPLSSDASAVVIVMPALGPSFGIAPAGTWRWNSRSSKASSSMPSASACPRTYDSAIRADSFMTSPSCPVRTRPSLPFIEVASMNSTSPPAPVTDRPVATPGIAVRSADSWKKRCRPRASRSSSRSMATGASALPAAIFVAVFRSSVPSSRSRFRTPASRVYSVTTLRSTSSAIDTSSSRRPLRSRWRGHR